MALVSAIRDKELQRKGCLPSGYEQHKDKSLGSRGNAEMAHNILELRLAHLRNGSQEILSRLVEAGTPLHQAGKFTAHPCRHEPIYACARYKIRQSIAIQLFHL